MLAGIAAMLVALSLATYLRQDACLDAGGQWSAVARTCELAAGREMPGPTGAYLAGTAAGFITLVVLWRTYTFVVNRAAERAAERAQVERAQVERAQGEREG